MTTTLYEKRLAREAQIKKLVDQDLSQNDIARELQISPQAVQKFLQRRGWKTREARKLEAARSQSS